MAGLKFRNAAKKLWQEKTHIVDSDRGRAQNHNGKGQAVELLLMRDVFVHGQEYIELAGVGDKLEQLAILDGRPARI